MRNYIFDGIRSNWIVAVVFAFIVTSPVLFVAIFYSPSMQPYLPSFLYRSIFFSFLTAIIIAILIVLNKRRLFWKEIHVVIDEEKQEIAINKERWSFSDLVYFEYREGSVMSSGAMADGNTRWVLFLKFKETRAKMLMPCKSSKRVGQYDDFIKDFENLIVRLNLKAKRKELSKPMRRLLKAMIFIVSPSVFFFMWGAKGLVVALKIIPQLMMLVFVSSTYLKRKEI